MLHDSKRVKVLLIIAVIVLAIIAGVGRNAISQRAGLLQPIASYG